MPRTSVSRVAAGAVIAAALAAGSLSLTAAAAGARATPGRVAGVPPAAAAALECSEPKCLSGTDPATAPWPGHRLAGQAGHGGLPARAAAGMSATAAAASAHAGAAPINCPPPNPEVTTPISDC